MVGLGRTVIFLRLYLDQYLSENSNNISPALGVQLEELVGPIPPSSLRSKDDGIWESISVWNTNLTSPGPGFHPQDHRKNTNQRRDVPISEIFIKCPEKQV